MPLTPGSRLGPYEITAAIGAGGMGEVYRAHDPKLSRDVAIKVLPEAFAGDAARMVRFQRESTVLASLDHPNIASIYGLEDSSGTRALVMQLVEGPTLAERIKQGPIPVDEAIRIARQIADALEYAHERGIVHRDLKPANVKVTNDDAVKVLDFGLAKALEGDAASFDISTSPTLSRLATMQGVLLGTAAYMSPEQAKAKPVDRRADIWAFGCVLYEMLTGKQAFTGETVTDTLAAVIRAEPDWSQLPAGTPMRVRVLLQRCLQKDVRQRLQAMGDARISLDEVLFGAPEAVTGAGVSVAPFWRRALPWAVAAAVTLFAAGLGVALLRTHPATPVEPLRFHVAFPEGLTSPVTGAFAVSPDGRQLAFAASGSGVSRIWVRPLNSLEARPLPGSESPLHLPFFWSPDSRFIAFDAGGKLKKIPIAGGPADTICDLGTGAPGGSWNRDGVIIFGSANNGGLMKVSAGGGSASPLTALDRSRGEIRHDFPWFLPDGRHFIYFRSSGSQEKNGLFVGSLDSNPEEQNSKMLVASQDAGAYVASADDPDLGQLLFFRDGRLLAQPFDARRLQLTGDALTLVEGVGSSFDFAYFSVSANGVLVYRTGGAGSQQLTWYDGQGKVLGRAGEPGALNLSQRLSPDGSHAAVSRDDNQNEGVSLWQLDSARAVSTRFTFSTAIDVFPVWSPDGSRIIFASNREGVYNLYEKQASGASDEELLLKSSEDKYPSSWSRDGRFLLYVAADPKTKYALWILPLEGDKKPFPFLSTAFNEGDGQFSPDEHWVAYVSDESGRLEIYVRPFSPASPGSPSGAGGKWLISNGGGSLPRWRGDGRGLYYVAADGELMAVEITTSPAFQAGAPKALFQAPWVNLTSLSQWDVTADGKRFLFPASATQSAQPPFAVVLNWQAALKK